MNARRVSRAVVQAVALAIATTLIVAASCTWWVGVIDAGQVARGVTAESGYAWLLTHYQRPTVQWTTAKAIWDVEVFQGGKYAKPEALLDPERHPWMRPYMAPPTADLPFEYYEGRGFRGWPWPALAADAFDTPAPGRITPPEGGETSPWPWMDFTHEARIDDDATVSPRVNAAGFALDVLVYGLTWFLVLLVVVPTWKALGGRRLLRASLFAISLGAIGTIGVAWSCAAFIDVNASNVTMHGFAGASAPPQHGTVIHYVNVGVDRVRVHHEGPARNPAEPAILCADRRGWPLPAFESTVIGHRDAISHAIVIEKVRAGIALGSPIAASFDEVRVLPLRIIWSGFALDWAIYTTTLFLAFSLIGVPEWIRRGHRARRGACPECAYDLQSLGGRCPECGWD